MTTRRQFFRVTAAGLAAAAGVATRPWPVRAQGPTVRIGTAVLADFGLVGPIAVAHGAALLEGRHHQRRSARGDANDDGRAEGQKQKVPTADLYTTEFTPVRV